MMFMLFPKNKRCFESVPIDVFFILRCSYDSGKRGGILAISQCYKTSGLGDCGHNGVFEFPTFLFEKES